MKAIFNKITIAESDNTILLEGNHYFPFASLNTEYLTETTHKTTCPWKGEASYYSVSINGEIGENVAWFYKEPSDRALKIKGHVAFWKGVSIVENK